MPLARAQEHVRSDRCLHFCSIGPVVLITATSQPSERCLGRKARNAVAVYTPASGFGIQAHDAGHGQGELSQPHCFATSVLWGWHLHALTARSASSPERFRPAQPLWVSSHTGPAGKAPRRSSNQTPSASSQHSFFNYLSTEYSNVCNITGTNAPSYPLQLPPA